MKWIRGASRAVYLGTYQGCAVVARRVHWGWEVTIAGERLLIRNRRVKTWLSARAVVEHVIRGHIDGPGSATASVGHVGQGEVAASYPRSECMPGSVREHPVPVADGAERSDEPGHDV